ncbi:MAG: type II secretion system F family protein [Mogibacterium sp.]|nr:type II secretion system F family protein [Mogibacterium sp.]
MTELIGKYIDTGEVKRVFRDPSVRKKIYILTLTAVLLILVITVRGPEQHGTVLTDSSGNAVRIRRHSLTTSEQYDMTLRVIDDGKIEEKDITLTVRASQENTEDSSNTGRSAATADSDSEIQHEAEIDAEIDSLLTEIEFSDDEEITLPSQLPDGTPVTWEMRKQEDRSGVLLIPVLYLILVIMIIATEFNSGRDEEEKDRKEIMKGLPRFCNQLFLMMNAGMILSDAFERICDSYREYSASEMSGFQKELSEICDANRDHRTSTAAVISEYASKHNVKELVRIAAILTENEKRGSDVIESLSRESTYLWDDRKTVARESGRMIDTKMSWPLGLLLILLIVITMAPALMNM